MEILKQGNIEKKLEPKEFHCKECGCVFRADNTEYKIPDCWGSFYDRLEASYYCPTCGKVVEIYR